jgi:hypothetical protein
MLYSFGQPYASLVLMVVTFGVLGIHIMGGTLTKKTDCMVAVVRALFAAYWCSL